MAEDDRRPTREPVLTTMRAILGHCLSALAGAAALVLGLAATALWVPVPGVDFVAALATAVWAWVALVACCLTVLFLVLARHRRTRWRVLGGVAALVGLVGYGVAGVEQLAVAGTFHVHVNPLAAATGHDDVDERTSYTDKDGTKLPMAVFKPRHVQGAPVIMWVHGGGWTSGDHDETAHNRWLADQGYLVVSAEYSLSDQTHHRWNQTTGQLLCAMGQIARYAKAHGADSTRIATMGDSAGGHLAMLVGYQASSGSPCGDTLPQVKAVATIYPVADPVAFANAPDPVVGRFSAQAAREFTGGTPSQVPGRYAAIDPARLVTAKTPPTSMVYGDSDHLVPPQATRELGERLRRAGVDVNVIGIPHGEHVMDLNVDDVGSQVFRVTSLRFLQAHGMAVG